MESEKSRIPDDLPPQPDSNPPPYNAQPQPQPQLQPQPTAVAFVGPMGSVMMPVAVPLLLGTRPAPMTCRSCNGTITTRIEKKVTTKTHLFALGLCAVGLWCIVCLPYLMDSCHSIDHYCPHCNAYIGSSRN